MNKKLVSSLIITAVVSTGLLAGCGAKKEASTDALKDGKYKAEASDFDDKGWKPFVEMEVKDGKIATVKFDYTDKNDKLKSENAKYNADMEAKVKTGPAKYTKQLSEDLVAKQDPAKVDTVTGATHSTDNFKKLSTQLVDNAKKGDTAVSKVTIK